MNSKNNISENAYLQYKLIKEHDPTIKDKFLRIDISGKGCDGFEYSLSFQNPITTDLNKDFIFNNIKVPVYFSSFAAEYINYCYIDYMFDPSNNHDHFVVLNLEEDKFKGKFWLKK